MYIQQLDNIALLVDINRQIDNQGIRESSRSAASVMTAPSSSTPTTTAAGAFVAKRRVKKTFKIFKSPMPLKLPWLIFSLINHTKTFFSCSDRRIICSINALMPPVENSVDTLLLQREQSRAHMATHMSMAGLVLFCINKRCMGL